MPIDFVFNGQASNSSVAEKLMAANMDAGALRPWIGENGLSYVTLNKGGKPVAVRTNAQATLTKEAWLQLDTQILKVARNRLRAVADLRAAGLTFNVANGMGTTVLEYQKMNDTGSASISMDGLRLGSDFRPYFESAYLPLPIIHSDFQYSLRQVMASRQSGAPLDTTTGEMAARRVAESCEQMSLGRLSTYTYGGGTIYGMANFPSRLTGVVTDPSSTGWTAATHLTEVLGFKQTLQNAKHYGPYVIYYSSAWDRYLDDDFNTNYPNKTLRNRIKEIDGISDVRTLDYLDTDASTYNMLILEMDTGTVRLVIGMDFTTLEWDDMGGLRKNYKVMCIIIPQLRADIDGNTGILHAATS
jgi:uncharacterized linocin/CFP29 family protein